MKTRVNLNTLVSESDLFIIAIKPDEQDDIMVTVVLSVHTTAWCMDLVIFSIWRLHRDIYCFNDAFL